MRKFILGFVAFLASLAFCYYIVSTNEDINHPQKAILQIDQPVEPTRAIPVLDAVNTRNNQIRSVICNLHVIAQMPGRRPVKLNGTMCYEKEKKFRIELDSLIGTELDIGADGKIFWFWSKRMQEPGLYWAQYKDFSKTKLKTPFNPFWLSHCLGVDKIDYSGAIIDQTGERWRIMKKTINGKGEPVTAVIYVDPQKRMITGHGMYDSSNRLVASCEIESFENGMPAKMTFMWHQENASMIWNLNNIVVNVQINPAQWIIPNYSPKIDMSRE
jgi:hypothetical protein